MGASLVKIVLGNLWAQVPGLTPQSRVLLAHMAITAKDNDKPPLYFGGRDLMVLAVLGDLAPEGPPREGQYRYITKLLRPIKEAGGVRQVTAAKRGRRRAAYEIDVYAALSYVANPATSRQDDNVANSATSQPGSTDEVSAASAS